VPDELVETTQRATGRGLRVARRAAGLVRIGVDSPMETRSRMLRVLSGLPELQTDIRFHTPTGELRRRLDAGDRATRTAVEYDGRHHVEREAQWESDVLRREEFEDQEWRIMTLVSKDIFVSPGRTIERMATVFASRGMRVGPRKDEWRRYFPERDSGH
jgi:very-short-patch-repair endonuclease